MDTYIYISLSIWLHVCTSVAVDLYICIFTYTCTYIYRYIYIYIYLEMHTYTYSKYTQRDTFMSISAAQQASTSYFAQDPRVLGPPVLFKLDLIKFD